MDEEPEQLTRTHLHVRLPAQMLWVLEQMAEMQDRSVSWVVRKILTEYLKKHKLLS